MTEPNVTEERVQELLLQNKQMREVLLKLLNVLEGKNEKTHATSQEDSRLYIIEKSPRHEDSKAPLVARTSAHVEEVLTMGMFLERHQRRALLSSPFLSLVFGPCVFFISRRPSGLQAHDFVCVLF